MRERKQIEGTICDWFADHLDFIAPGLNLIFMLRLPELEKTDSIFKQQYPQSQ